MRLRSPSAGWKSYVNCRHHNGRCGVARFLDHFCQSHIRRPSPSRRPSRVDRSAAVNASLPGASVKCIIDAALNEHSEPVNNLRASADKSLSEVDSRVTVRYAKDTRTRNRYRNPYQKTCTGFLQVCHPNRYRFFSGTEIWYGVEQCSTRCRKP